MHSVEELLALDFYGNLLTDKMRTTLEMHLNDDMSLAEIAESENISRQGVHDTIKRALKQLNGYEEKLGLVARFTSQRDTIDKAISLIDNGDTDKARDVLEELMNELTME